MIHNLAPNSLFAHFEGIFTTIVVNFTCFKVFSRFAHDKRLLELINMRKTAADLQHLAVLLQGDPLAAHFVALDA